MPKRKINLGVLITVIVVVTTLVAVVAGLGGIDGAKDFFAGSASNTTTTIGTKTAPQKRSRAVVGKPYAELVKEGNQLVTEGDLEGALEMFQQAAQLSPKDAVPYEKVGDVFVMQGKYEKAAESYRFAFSLNSNNRILFLKKVRSLMNGRKISEAQAELAKVQTKTPEIMYLESLINSFFNYQQKARDGLKEILALKESDENPTDLTPLKTIKTNAQKIAAMYDSFEIAKESPLSYLQALLAKTYNEIGEYGLSIETAFEALKIQNDYRDVWITLGHSFLKTQRWFDAEDALTKAIALDQKQAASYFYRGLARVKIQKVRDALADFSLAIDFGYKPQIQAEYEAANAEYILGENDKALALYKKVLTTDPSILSYFKRPIELALFAQYDSGTARMLVDLALKNHPKNAVPYAWAALIKVRENNLFDARTLLDKATSLDKQEVFAQLAQAELDRVRGNKEAAQAQYTQLIEKFKTSNDVLLEKYIESVTTQFALPSLDLN